MVERKAVKQTGRLGLALTIVVAALFGLTAGRKAGIAALVFGLVATSVQMVAAGLAGPKIWSEDYRGLLKNWALGTGIRLVGVVLVGLASLVAREHFPPMPTALGYLLVLIPLLFFEIRHFRT